MMENCLWNKQTVDIFSNDVPMNCAMTLKDESCTDYVSNF